ncbi:unnamed protein product [Moneuplotes crassus]|uniref:Uncharacterized protein n=1 Tax=Euplotes crassus TaxID=5936 RepID=A0AAD1XX85_EUPCR|nr:unnamed protein product [Moneuplotes crassus]
MANIIEFQKTDNSLKAIISQDDTNIGYGFQGDQLDSLNKTVSVVCVNTDDDFKLRDGSTAFMLRSGRCNCWTNPCPCDFNAIYGTTSLYSQGIYKEHNEKVYTLEDLSKSSLGSTFPDIDGTLSGLFTMTEDQYDDAEFPDEKSEDFAVCFSKIHEENIDSTQMPESFRLADGYERSNIIVNTS